MNFSKLISQLTRGGLLEVVESGDRISVGPRCRGFLESPFFHDFHIETSPQDFCDLYGYLALDGHFDFSQKLKNRAKHAKDDSYLQFLKVVNGGSFFAGYLLMFGHGTICRIGSIALANQDEGVAGYVGGIEIGYYFYDGSYIVLCESGVKRVSRGDFLELASWRSFDDFYLSEFSRLNEAFDVDLQLRAHGLL